MTTETKFGCSHTELWVSPEDWKTSKEAKKSKDWYVQCYFFDPIFKEKYPNGFQFRKRANKPKTLEKKQELVKYLLEKMKSLLASGYNPITQQIMGQFEIDQDINEDTPVITALEFVFNKREDNDTKIDLRSVLKYFVLAIRHLHLDGLRISEIKRKHIKFALEYLQKNEVIEKRGKGGVITYHTLPDKRRNKYIDYLSGLFKDIIEYEVIENNPCHEIKNIPIIQELRQVLTPDQRKQVNNHLKENYRPFWLFTIIFFHSGGRMKELLNLKMKDVDLKN